MSLFICTGNEGKLKEFKHLFNSTIGINDVYNFSGVKFEEPQENSDLFLSNCFVKLIAALQYVVKSTAKSHFDIKKVIVDDSGLCVPALGFLPGVHSAYFSGKPKNDEKNNLKLKKLIQDCEKSLNYKDEKRLKSFFVSFVLEAEVTDEISHFLNDDFKQAKGFENQKIFQTEKLIFEKVTEQQCSFSQTLKFSDFESKFPEKFIVKVHTGFCFGEVSTQEQSLKNAGFGYDPLFYSSVHRELSFASIGLEEKNKLSHRARAIEALKNFKEN